jgi:hypothetical protein
MDQDNIVLPQMEDRTVIESINKADLKPMYDTNHEHNFVKDPDDETNDYYAVICNVSNCNIGKLISK